MGVPSSMAASVRNAEDTVPTARSNINEFLKRLGKKRREGSRRRAADVLVDYEGKRRHDALENDADGHGLVMELHSDVCR